MKLETADVYAESYWDGRDLHPAESVCVVFGGENDSFPISIHWVGLGKDIKKQALLDSL